MGEVSDTLPFQLVHSEFLEMVARRYLTGYLL